MEFPKRNGCTSKKGFEEVKPVMPIQKFLPSTTCCLSPIKNDAMVVPVQSIGLLVSVNKNLCIGGTCLLEENDKAGRSILRCFVFNFFKAYS